VKQIAQNKGRFYRVDVRQMRYFPIAAIRAQAMLAAGEAFEVAYQPFSRKDLFSAYKAAQVAA